MKKVTCAGCDKHYPSDMTTFYRKKRWCFSTECKEVIDEKVKNFNYKKRQRKIELGKYRNGVTQELRMSILDRDTYSCNMCGHQSHELGKMQVHHIVPVSHGGSDSESNLVTLCKPCHMYVHNSGWEKYVSSFKTNNKKMGTSSSKQY